MKKIVFVLISLFLMYGYLNAEIAVSRYKITESEKEFDVMYFLTPDMKVIESKENDDVNITQSFEITKNNLRGELRYSLFTDLGGDSVSLEIQYAMWVFMCINNIAGYEVPSSSFSNFNDSDVKNEFNGDFGCTIFIQNPKSQYGNGYNFMMVEFFARKNQGLVMRAFIFNETGFMGINEDGSISESSPLFSNYHTFRFMEKDSAGNFIQK